jgi:guanosine-diphosphatase
MRRTSVSLPTRNVAHDPYEKAGRYSTTGAREGAAGILEKAKAAWMTQSQRARYLKTGGILLFVVFLFYYLTPSGVDVYNGGMVSRTRRAIVVQSDANII